MTRARAAASKRSHSKQEQEDLELAEAISSMDEEDD